MSTDLSAIEEYARDLAESEPKMFRVVSMGILYRNGAYEAWINHHNDAVTRGRGDSLIAALAARNNQLRR